MTQPTEPQEPTDSATEADSTTQPTAQWLTIYESETVKADVLLRDGYVTRLLVNTPETLPFSFAGDALKRWNTDPRRHLKVYSEEWVLTYKEGTQPQYFTTVETTFRDLEWTVIDTEPGIVVSVVEDEGKVTHVRLDWSSEADLEPEEAGTVCFVDNALHDWNTVPGRQFHVDEEEWKEVESGDNLRFETTVETTFQTVLEVYIDTPAPLQHANLVHTVLALLSGKLPESDVDFVSLFGSVRRAEQYPFVRVLRTYVDNGEYYLETESGCGVLPPYKVPLSLEVVEPALQAFEHNLAANLSQSRKRHCDLLELRKVYREIAQEQGLDLASVNLRRSSSATGPFLPDAYVQGTPEPPEEVLADEPAAVTQIYVPPGWCAPTYQSGALVWHNCHQYQVTRAAPNHSWCMWSYTVIPIDHNEKPDFISNMQGYLLEHQLGNERPAYCDKPESFSQEEDV